MPKASMKWPARSLFAASCACAACAGIVSAIAPPTSPWPALGALGAVAISLGFGVTQPWLEMFGDVRWRLADRTALALTFDDGPSPRTTPSILDALDAHDAKASFFAIGRKVAAHPALARSIVDRGHTLGCHSFAHDRFLALRPAKTVRSDLLAARAAIEDATGVACKLFRPPVAIYNPILAHVAKELEFTMIGHSIRGRDGRRTADADWVLARLERLVKGGAIVILHDAAEHEDFEPIGVRKAGAILAMIAQKGLKCVRIEP
jgi:peptidoglycan/xylan/chitin deacetylase (PgdA/CDA1 family)